MKERLKLKLHFELTKQSSCSMQLTNTTDKYVAFKKAPEDLQSKDKFLVQGVVMEEGRTTKDTTPEMFNKSPGKVF